MSYAIGAPSNLIEARLDMGLNSFFIVKTMVFATSHMPWKLHRGSLKPASIRASTVFNCRNNGFCNISYATDAPSKLLEARLDADLNSFNSFSILKNCGFCNISYA